jgi:MFS family permease
LFILPFLLFSATAGQLADKYDKRSLIVLLKNLELGIAAVTSVGLISGSPGLLLGAIFLFGLHSTVFGPVKYSYLPQHLETQELTGGNGLVEMGTFVSILLGTLAGGWLISLPPGGLVSAAEATSVACVGLAALGRWAAHKVPTSPPSDPQLAINWNPVTETWRNLKLAYPLTAVFRSLLGISWMWLFGSLFLAQFPSFTKDVMSRSRPCCLWCSHSASPSVRCCAKSSAGIRWKSDWCR